MSDDVGTFTVSQQATANASGVATITGFTAPAGRRGFIINTVQVRVTGSTKIPAVTAYKGAVNPATIIGSRRAGDQGTMTGTGDILWPGEILVVQWTGCSPGALCTAVLAGKPRVLDPALVVTR